MRYFLHVSTVLLCLALGMPGQAEPFASPRELYDARCGRCHVAPAPGLFEAQRWPEVLAGMRLKADLSREDERRILDYLQGASAPPAEGSASLLSPGAPRLGGYLYTEYFRDEEQAKNFDLHYLAVAVEGSLSSRVRYLAEFELEHGGKGDNTFVEQAWIDMELHREHVLRVGALLAPFNRFDEYHEPALNPLVTRPLASREIGVSAWKDVGVQLYGQVPGLQGLGYDLFALNGLGAGASLRGSRQYRDNNEELTLGLRLHQVLRDRLEAGFSLAGGAWDDGGEHGLRHAGAHLLWRGARTRIHAEYLRAESENPSPLEHGNMSGWFLQLGRELLPAWQLTTRFGALRYEDPGDQLGRLPRDLDQREAGLGLGWTPVEGLLCKAEYMRFLNRASDEDRNQLGLQLSLSF